MRSTPYNIVGLGGTFDHFHIGHETFLQFAASLGEEIRIGVTVPSLTQHKVLSHLIESYETREKNVRAFLDNENIHGKVFPLLDPFGPTLENSHVQAISVTELTYRGGVDINTKRAVLNLPALPIESCAVRKDATGEYISSTRIREGKINRRGDVYAHLFTSDFTLTPMQKKFFQEKQGPIIVTPSSAEKKYVVGDIVLETFLENHWPFDVGVYDEMNNRQHYHSKASLDPDIRIENPAGIIRRELVTALEKSLPRICIIGEEDLAAVALVLLAPLNAAIYYGQPGEGIVEMIVTEELKERFYSVLRK